MRRAPKPESFEKFYYSKVALGENCGCAERVIDNKEIDRLMLARKLNGPSFLSRLLRKLMKRS